MFPSVTQPQPDRIGYSLYDNGPVYDPLSLNITCGFNPIPGPPKLIAPVRAGSNVRSPKLYGRWKGRKAIGTPAHDQLQMTITWTAWPSNHIGSTMTYLAHCPNSCQEPNLDLAALEFFKIHQDGLHADKTWFSEHFIENNSTLTVPIPKAIQDGEYLVRHEQLSLHAVNDPKYGPEVYYAHS